MWDVAVIAGIAKGFPEAPRRTTSTPRLKTGCGIPNRASHTGGAPSFSPYRIVNAFSAFPALTALTALP